MTDNLQRKGPPEKYIKSFNDAAREVQEMAEYLEVSDRKQIGATRTLLKSASHKYDLHEFLLAIVRKLQALEEENAARKSPGRPRAVSANTSTSSSLQWNAMSSGPPVTAR